MGKISLAVSLAIVVAVCRGARYTVQPTSTASSAMPTPMEARTSPPVEEPASLPPPICADSLDTNTPLARLRAAMMASPSYDAFIIFFSDEHLSSEPSIEDRRLEYVSGWDGAGVGAVLAERAAVWVPGGEVRRALATLSCAWQVYDADDFSQIGVGDWIVERLKSKGMRRRIGGDSRLTSHMEWQALSATLAQAGHQLMNANMLLDQLWAVDPTNRRLNSSKIVASLHHPDYTGMSWRDKVSAVRKELMTADVDAMVVTALDEVAWLLNIRGRDLPYAPLLKAFVVVSMREVRIYAPQGKLSMPVREALAVYNCYTNNCTRVIEYMHIYNDLRRAAESRILVPASGTFQRGASEAIAQAVPETKRVLALSPIVYLKAQKNEAEGNGMKKAHLKDAVAMCTLLNYLEKQSKAKMTEMSVGRAVDMTRETQAGHVGAAMRTRVAFGPSGAEPEYRATPASNRSVFTNSTLIIRSGGQYEEGTTVVTRTVHYGVPTREMRRAYTVVLRAVAALATLQAPATMPAAHVDPVARAPLWAARQDYVHPTGHGVGAALNRKEDPVVVDYRQDINLHPFKDGYYINSEPGWYERKFGVRLGNVLEVISKNNLYVSFREATLIPFEPKLVEWKMLTDYELNWLNSYNERIRNIVGPELKEQGLIDVYYWMMNKTQHVDVAVKKVSKSNAASLCTGTMTLIDGVIFLIIFIGSF